MIKVHMIARLLFAALVLAGVSTAPLSAWADSKDQARAREAMLRGDISPLSEALGVIEKEYPGEILEVELEEADNFDPPVFLYEIKVLMAEGEVIKVKLHAKSLEIIGVKGHDSKHNKNDNDND
ncbi:MAG: hypothetical protein NUV50_08130 [Rhodospirillales bacterium]|nr:hypothetical protein [Rhodospirillales bacterium]